MTALSSPNDPPQSERSPPILNTAQLHARLDEIKERMGPPPWSTLLTLTDEMQAVVIYQAPGTPNDRHYHLHDEWWVVMEGEISWEMEGYDEPVIASAGDFVLAPRNTFHHIRVLGDTPAVRIGITVVGEFHRHDR